MRVISASGPVASDSANYTLGWAVALPGCAEFWMTVEIADAGLDEVVAFAQAVMPTGAYGQVKHHDLGAWDASIDGDHVATLWPDGRIEHHGPEPEAALTPW